MADNKKIAEQVLAAVGGAANLKDGLPSVSPEYYAFRR